MARRSSSERDTVCRDASVHPQTPGRRVDRRDVEVSQKVVETHRCDRVAQRFEQDPVVARRQLQLLHRHATKIRIGHDSQAMRRPQTQ